jgi:hypothetical protein
MIMKKLFIIAIATLVGTGAFAQVNSTTGTKPSPLKFGLKAGVNLPKYVFSDDGDEVFDTKTTTNFHVTGYLDAPVGSYFAVQPGISLQGKGGKIESSAMGINSKTEQNTMWIEVPVNLVGKVPLGIGGSNVFLGAGPYLGFGISGETKSTVANVTTETDVNFGKDDDDDLKGTDFGVNFIGGVQLNNGFNIGAGYGLGLTDLRPGSENADEGKFTNRVWSFSVGYSF